MNGSAGSSDAIGVAQTWPLQAVAASVAVAPLPVSDAAATVPNPSNTADASGRHPREGGDPETGNHLGEALDPRLRGDDGTGAATSGSTEQEHPEGPATDPVSSSAPRAGGLAVVPAASPAIATTDNTATTQATQPPSFGEPTGAAGAVGGTVLALLLVVAVILALAWLAKRMPGFGSASGVGNQSLKIVGSLALGPRERVVVVAVGDTQLLLSTGPHGTRALHTLEQPLPLATASPNSFAQVLAQQFGRKQS